MALLPDEEKNKSDLVKQFGEDWELRAATLEITRKHKPWYSNVWPRQHQVKIMYLWIKINWSQFSNRNLPFPIDHDNIPKAPGQPVLYALLGGWTIPKEDLNYLAGGPLYSESWKLLVPKQTKGWGIALFRGRKAILWASTAIAIIGGAYWLFNNYS